MVLASACGTSTPTAASSPSPSAAGSATPTPVACSTAGAASPDWPAPDSANPGRIVSAVASGDDLTLTFVRGTPQFDVTPQGTAQFTADPSGQSVTLAGNAGVLIHLRGFQATAQRNLGAITLSSVGPELMDAKGVGDFEGVVSIGAGLQSTGCSVVVASGSSLKFHFVSRPAAGG